MSTENANASGPAARRLRDALEPVVGSVYFSPECHAEYVSLGFSPSPGLAAKTALPDGPAYFTSRGSCMGQVAGEVVAAAFAVFNPAAVVPSVTYGWSLTDAPTIAAARTRGAVAQLARILGPEPGGIGRVVELLQRAAETLQPAARPLFAGVLSLGLPGSPLGDAWRIGDRLREYRGDSHNLSWCSAGLDAVEIGLLSEAWWGVPLHSYIRTRAWSDDQVGDALSRLEARAWIADRRLTEAGRDARERIEAATDLQMRSAVEALGDDATELFAILEPWGAAIREAGGYLSAGPDTLAAIARAGGTDGDGDAIR